MQSDICVTQKFEHQAYALLIKWGDNPRFRSGIFLITADQMDVL